MVQMAKSLWGTEFCPQNAHLKKKVGLGEVVKKVKHGGVCAHICIAGTRERELAEPWASLTGHPSIVSEL